MTLGEFVSNYRLEHGLSQRQFAIKCGVSNGYVSMIEKNINPKTQQPLVPSIPALTKIASGLDLTLNDLFRLVDEMPVDISTDSQPAYIMDNPFPEKKPTPVSEDRLNEEQLEIIRLYEAAPPALRAAALAVLRAAEDPDKVPGGVSTAE